MNLRLALLAVLLAASSVQAQTTLAPTADAYVRDGTNATKNFGKATTLQVGTSTKAGNNYDSYLKFDSSAVPAFAQARLRLFAGLSASGSVTANVYAVPRVTWSETAITWNNKPARGALLRSATVKSKTAAFIEIDLTAYLLAERAQGRNVVSLALHSAANTAVILKANSKEAKTNKPQLVFTADKAPSVALTAPAANSVFAAPASINLAVSVADPDGSIAKVQYFQGATLIGTATSAPYSFTWNNVVAGSYSLTAKATDNSGVSTASGAVNALVDAPPSVSLTSPADQSSYRAPAAFDLGASASDSDGSIARVAFYQGATLLQTLTQAPYSIPVTQGTPGTYTYFAKATDNAGITAQSGVVTVIVKPDAAPLITLSAPLDGTRFRAPASITLTAAANDPDGSILRVDFFQGATPIGSATQPPYSITLNQLNVGSYTFSAQAVDDAGLITQSPSATVIVAGAPALYYIHADQINTPRIVTDQATKVVWRWDTADPFGASAPDEDADGDGVRFTLNLRFPGQYFDRETGLHYNYFRDYDPGTGSYVESDPIGIGGGLNTYGYVQANPLQRSDPLGLKVYISGHIAGGVGVGAAGNFTSPPSYHFTVVMRPDHPSDFSDRTGWQQDSHGLYATVGGQPSGVAGGNLVSKPSYPGDSPGNGWYWINVETPQGMTDTDFINRLIKASRCYDNKQPYSRPDRKGYMPAGTYNSNSYVSGVIKAAGGTPPLIDYDWFQAPGYTNPLPIPSECMCKP